MGPAKIVVQEALSGLCPTFWFEVVNNLHYAIQREDKVMILKQIGVNNFLGQDHESMYCQLQHEAT